MPESIRSFIAFDMDDESVLRKISEVQGFLARTGADLKLVEPRNVHITVRFLGDISPANVEKIFGEMQKVQFLPFDVKLQGIGAFPTPHSPRVVWTGMTEGTDKLRGIFDQLEVGLLRLGFAPDPKGFSPHLTIARVRSGRNKAELAKCILENKGYEFGVVRAGCLRLKKSDLTPKGPVYSTLKEFCPQEL